MLARNESQSPALPDEIMVPIFQPAYPVALLTALMLNHLMAQFLRGPNPDPAKDTAFPDPASSPDPIRIVLRSLDPPVQGTTTVLACEPPTRTL
jgi:hypothetical protein